MGGNEANAETGPRGIPSADRSGEGFQTAMLKALLIIALSVVAFVLLPDRLFSYLALHVSPRARDGLVLLWVAMSFVFLTWLFVRLQRGSTGE